jgi:hypothetical protein
MTILESIRNRVFEMLGGQVSEAEEALSGDVLGTPEETEAAQDILTYLKAGRLWELYGAATKLSETRGKKYKDYEDMETEVIVASALELIVDDAFQYSIERHATIWPDESSEYAKEIRDFFKKIDLENRIWGWTYNVAKYGDLFLGINAEEGKGITRIIDDNHPSKVFRIEIDGALAGFVVGDRNTFKAEALAEPWDFVHFMNNYKPTFEKVILTVKEEQEVEDEQGNTEVKEVDVKKAVTSSYGTSCLYHTRLAYKILNLLEKSLALARLARSPLMRIFYVNTEGLTPKERKKMIKDLKKTFQAREAVDLTSKLYDSDYNPMTFMDDLFVPITGSVGDLRAEQLGGEIDIKSMVDIDYAKNKLFAGLRIPKAFLGFEESLPGSLGSTTLTRLDIRYARMVKKVQRAVLHGLTRLAQIHLAYMKQERPDPEKIMISAVNVSGAEEEDRQNTFERKLNLANMIIGFIRDLEGKIDPKVLVKYIFTKVVELTDVDITALMNAPKPPPGEEGGAFAAYSPEIDKLVKEIIEAGDDLDKDRVVLLIEALERAAGQQKKFSTVRPPKDTGAPLGIGKEEREPNEKVETLRKDIEDKSKSVYVDKDTREQRPVGAGKK